jgi:hypothetical protein
MIPPWTFCDLRLFFLPSELPVFAVWVTAGKGNNTSWKERDHCMYEQWHWCFKLFVSLSLAALWSSSAASPVGK